MAGVSKSSYNAPTGRNKAYDRVVPGSLFEHIKRYGDAEFYEPSHDSEPVQVLPGSAAKIEAMRRRIENGYSAFNPRDGICDDETARDDMRITTGGGKA